MWTLAISGCDVVWRLDDLRPASPPDAGDADDADDASDAPPMPVHCDEDAHDEDGDGVVDACDLCPGIADDQADADGDGVGDACDPSVTAHNERVLFISFAAGEPWRTVNGTWTRDGESLVYESVTLDMYGITLFQGLTPPPPFVVEYHFSVDSIAAQSSGVAVIVDADDSGSGVTCGVQRHESPVKDVVRSAFGQATLSSETNLATVTPGGYRVTATYDRDDSMRCSLAADSGVVNGATTMQLPSSPVPAPGTLGIRSLRVGTHVHYIAIYR